MTHTSRLKRALALSVCCALSVSACSSNGGERFSSVGAQGPTGKTGASGPQGPSGASGPQGSQGPQGDAGMNGQDGNFNLGAAGKLGVGGLIGEGGVAGTGLLANTGDLNSSPQALSETLIFAGESIGQTTGGAYYVANLVDGALPGSTPLAGTVVGVLAATGQTLVQSGEGNVYLLDGLTAAPGDLITASIGGATALGSSDAAALLGLSVLSGAQQQGSLLTVGAGSGGELVTVGVGGTNLLGGEGALGVIPISAGGGAPGITPGGDGELLGGVEDTVGGILDPGGDGGLLGGVEDTVGGIVNQGSDEGGLLGGLGGLLGNN